MLEITEFSGWFEGICEVLETLQCRQSVSVGSRAEDAPSNWLPGDVATDGPWTVFQVARVKMIMNSVTVDTKISRLLALPHYHSSSRCC